MLGDPPLPPGRGLECGGSTRIRLGAGRRTTRAQFFLAAEPWVQKAGCSQAEASGWPWTTIAGLPEK